MYIQKVKLQNFRSFGDEGICFLFNKGINAVIGENNNGKTALIDAIRIAFSCVLYKKDIFFSKTDFHVNAAGERAAFAQIDVYLKDVPQNLIEIWDPIQPDCGEFHVVFTLEKTAAGTDKVKYRAWGGKCEGNLLSSDTLEAINLDYLSTLRDGVTVYGHVGADLITLASMLRIPVTMHNVPAEKIYRPHAWASFGTQDQQAADYAACKQYGPLYR